jgi:5-formyltetrahydrofolate cyclo-ligase
VSEVGKRAKRAIRARMRALRQAIPRSAREARSARICEHLLELPEYRSARGVGLYAPLDLEVAIGALDERARLDQKVIYYPFMDPTPTGFITGFRRVDSLAALVERGRAFREPPGALPLAVRGDIDLIVAPALAVAASGHRLGYGSGFYDVTLPELSPPACTVVVAFDFQFLAELPIAEHDVQVQIIVTDQRVVRPGE